MATNLILIRKPALKGFLASFGPVSAGRLENGLLQCNNPFDEPLSKGSGIAFSNTP